MIFTVFYLPYVVLCLKSVLSGSILWENVRLLNYFETYYIIGKRTCVEKCLLLSSCRSVNYNKVQLLCELVEYVTNDIRAVVQNNSNFANIEIDSKVELDNSTCGKCNGINAYILLKSQNTVCMRYIAPGYYRNVALNKITSASSVINNWISIAGTNFTVDGQTGITPVNKHCYHSEIGDGNPWLLVDLVHEYSIDHVVLYKGWVSLTTMEIRTGNDKTWNSMSICGQSRPVHINNVAQKASVRCGTCISGRYVMIRLVNPGNGYINLCEVEIFGRLS